MLFQFDDANNSFCIKFNSNDDVADLSVDLNDYISADVDVDDRIVALTIRNARQQMILPHDFIDAFAERSWIHARLSNKENTEDEEKSDENTSETTASSSVNTQNSNKNAAKSGVSESVLPQHVINLLRREPLPGTAMPLLSPPLRFRRPFVRHLAWIVRQLTLFFTSTHNHLVFTFSS